MTALILTGVAPSFAEEKEAISASADIDWSDAPSIEGTSGIMIDAGSGAVLYEKNAYEKRDPASITKILNALVVLETLDLDKVVTVSIGEIDPSGTNISLKNGEEMTVEQLLYAMLLGSANDAADALAVAAGGSIENFCEMMNSRAKKCGANDTDFSNASGLTEYGRNDHTTTAYDIAMIAREAMKNPVFRKIVSTEKYTIPATNMSKARKVETTNLCLYEDEKTVEVNGIKRHFKYEGTIGVKTGYTEAAGECFCGAAASGDTELITVVLNSSSKEQKFADTMALWDYGFSKYHTYAAAIANEPVETFRLWQGEKSGVAVTVADNMDITLNIEEDSSSIEIETEKNDLFITAPVEKGQVLGSIKAYNKEGDLIAESDLVAMSSIEKGGILSYIGIADEDRLSFFIGIIIFLLILMLIRMVYVSMRRKRKKRRRAERNRKIRRKEWEREKNPFDRQ